MFADNDNHAITDGHNIKARVNELCWECYDSVYNDLYLTLVNSSDPQYSIKKQTFEIECHAIREL